MGKETLLDVRNLSVCFGAGKDKLLAVDRVSFSVRKGETVALVGESGSGKTVSALSILNLLPYPAASHPSGEIWFEGNDLLHKPDSEMQEIRGDRISMIFQEPLSALNPVMKVGEQIVEGLRAHQNISKTTAREKAVAMLEAVAVPDAEQRFRSYPHELSGGLRQRAMIAMALVCGPKLLIADEPTTAVDVTVQAQILELLKDLKRRLGLSLLLISHDLGVVAKLADRVAVMYAGQLIELGPTEEVLGSPQHPYTAGLLRSLPSLEGARQKRLETLPGMVPDLRHLPPACRFEPRCGVRIEQCSAGVPPLESISPTHWVRCIRAPFPPLLRKDGAPR